MREIGTPKKGSKKTNSHIKRPSITVSLRIGSTETAISQLYVPKILQINEGRLYSKFQIKGQLWKIIFNKSEGDWLGSRNHFVKQNQSHLRKYSDSDYISFHYLNQYFSNWKIKKTHFLSQWYDLVRQLPKVENH